MKIVGYIMHQPVNIFVFVWAYKDVDSWGSGRIWGDG